MKIKVWVYVWDTETGTDAEVFNSHKDALLAMLGMALDGYAEGLQKEVIGSLIDRLKNGSAPRLIHAEFLQFVDENSQGMSSFWGIDTHGVDYQELELPSWIYNNLLSKQYDSEFESIDGVRQHPKGLNFDEWLVVNGYE